MEGNNSITAELMSTQVNFMGGAQLKHLAISGSGFVFDPTTGQSFTVNETGVELLRLFQQETNVGVIVEKQHKKYNGDSREIERDILEFASSLNRHFNL